MMIALAGGAVVSALSLLLGFAARRAVTRPAGVRAPGTPAGSMPAGGEAETGLPQRWPVLAARLLRPDRMAVAIAVWLALLDVVLSLAAPWPLKVVVDYALGHQPLPPWLAPLGGLRPVWVAVLAAMAGLLLLAASALTGYLVTVLGTAIGERMTVRLRAAVADRVLRGEPKATATLPLGELTSRLGGDTVRVSDTVTATLDTLLPDTALLAGMTVITAALDWRLTLVSVAVIPLYGVTARVRNPGLRVAQRQARDRAGELATVAAGMLARLPAVHVFDRAADEADRYHAASAASAAAEVAAVQASARFGPVTDTLPGLALAAALVTGTIEVTSGRLTLGGLVVFLAYLSSLTSPVRSLTRLSATFARGTASRDRLAELLRLPPLGPAGQVSPAELPDPAGLPSPPGPPCPADRAGGGLSAVPRPAPGGPRAGLEVALETVSFAHRAGDPVLDSASLRFPAAMLTALTGRSGSGKSTLLSLLIRLADPQSGKITVAGQDITRLPLSQLRDLVTLVPQEPWLHRGTIAENIGYGRRGASAGQVRTVADQAGVTAFADALPDGLDTPVGEHGHQLSGGQQRRVAIARALLRDTPVLLLDEPTTGLDPETEARLVTELLIATAGKTVIMVTHQPALVARADHIVRLSSGRLEPGGAFGMSECGARVGRG
jgi:ABC-type multidrug transport system fused ATPase/permease subunit